MNLRPLFLFAMLFSSTACAEDNDSKFSQMLDGLLDDSVPTIQSAELSRKISETPNLILLDAREQTEFEVSHLKGAKWIGYDDFDTARVAALDKNSPVIVYCSVGYRSEKIGEKLQKLGFTDVQNLRGGIFDWANRKLPVETAGESTPAVHPYDRKWGKWLKAHVEKRYKPRAQ